MPARAASMEHVRTRQIHLEHTPVPVTRAGRVLSVKPVRSRSRCLFSPSPFLILSLSLIYLSHCFMSSAYDVTL